MGCAVGAVGAVRAGGNGSAGMTARKNTSLSHVVRIRVRFWVVALVLLLLCFFKDDADDADDADESDKEDEDADEADEADESDKEDVEDMLLTLHKYIYFSALSGCIPLLVAIYEHTVIRVRAAIGFVITPKCGLLRLIHRSASYRDLFWIRSNTAPAFAARPCASLKRAWRSTCECLSCTLCSPGGFVSLARKAFYHVVVYWVMT